MPALSNLGLFVIYQIHAVLRLSFAIMEACSYVAQCEYNQLQTYRKGNELMKIYNEVEKFTLLDPDGHQDSDR